MLALLVFGMVTLIHLDALRRHRPGNNCGGTIAQMMFSKSTDGGNHWSTERVIHAVTLAPDPCGAFYGCLPNSNERVSNIPVSAVDNTSGPNRGAIYVVDYTYTGAYLKVQVTKSTVTWLDRRNDPADINYEEFGAVSTDGGATYPNFQIAATPSNPANDGFSGSFMGDYTGNAWAGEALYASWTDTSNGVNGQDVIGGFLTPTP
jgi:hypothetical protein